MVKMPQMLSETDLLALAQARHPDPFAVLGMHADSDGDLWVRALLPGAQRVVLHDTRMKTVSHAIDWLPLQIDSRVSDLRVARNDTAQARH